MYILGDIPVAPLCIKPYSNEAYTFGILIFSLRSKPSGYLTSKWRHFDVDETSWRRIDVSTMSVRRQVPAWGGGRRPDISV